MGYHKLACFGRSEIIVFQELHIEGTFQYRIPLIHLNLAMNCSFFHLYLLKKEKINPFEVRCSRIEAWEPA